MRGVAPIFKIGLLFEIQTIEIGASYEAFRLMYGIAKAYPLLHRYPGIGVLLHIEKS